ncbi:MAG: helix-hairpin-helix domain-containing protein [bacterium]|nr:helix-hairpin-helix domain-containing protein [bacterium]
MTKIKYYLEKFKILLIILIIIILILLLIGTLNSKTEAKVKEETIEVKPDVNKEVDQVKIKVDIKGYINSPGVYEMDDDSRIIDLINMAGGLLDDANTEYINLSKKLTDEMIVIIYSNSEVEKYKKEDKQIIYIEYECICPDNINDACITNSDTVNTNGIKNDSNIDNLISINTASLEELMTLNGIGESKAKAIIEYREKNNGFENLEDIMNVSGIGEAAYSKIKDYIKL